MSTYDEHFERFFKQVERASKKSSANANASEKLKIELRSVNKQLGQLVARSWLPNDPLGQEFRNVLVGDLNESVAERSSKIIKFLKKQGIEIEVLGDTVETVQVNWNSFSGTLTEDTRTYLLPYPPRPVEVTDVQLEAWVGDTDPAHKYPTTPYIPLSGF